MIRENGGRIVLMDLGAGYELDRDPDGPAPAPVGTPLYLAPEILKGGHPSERSDVYSLGVLLYHLATGGFPVTGQSVADVRRAHEEGRRTRLRDLRSDLPAALVAVIERAIDPDPEARYRSAGEVVRKP